MWLTCYLVTGVGIWLSEMRSALTCCLMLLRAKQCVAIQFMSVIISHCMLYHKVMAGTCRFGGVEQPFGVADNVAHWDQHSLQKPQAEAKPTHLVPAGDANMGFNYHVRNCWSLLKSIMWYSLTFLLEVKFRRTLNCGNVLLVGTAFCCKPSMILIIGML